MFSTENIKIVEKFMAKFFHYNAIPFNAVDSGHYYKVMINTIAEAVPGLKGPTGYQIGNLYLEEEMKEIDIYIYCFNKSKMVTLWLHDHVRWLGVPGIESLLLIS